MNLLRKQADQTTKGSLSSKFRSRRIDAFLNHCISIGAGLNIADVGGTLYHWKDHLDKLEGMKLTLINIEDDEEDMPAGFSRIKADARDLGFISDGEFDVAYSNSVIEHFPTFEEQKKVAAHIRRIAKNYYVQTPNYNFPVEPHFIFPFFQMLPLPVKRSLLKTFSLGWYEKQKDDSSAERLAVSIRLLKLKELVELFPGCRISREKFFLMNKSFTAYN